MQRITKRLLSLAVVVVMVLSMLPVNAVKVFAADTATSVTTEATPVVEVATEDALIEALANSGEIKLVADITTTKPLVTSGVTATIDLNGKTLKIGAGDNKFNDASDLTIKNGNINIDGVVVKGNAVFCLDEYEETLVTTLTLNNVNLTGKDYSSAYGVFYIGDSSVLNVNGGQWILTDDLASAGGVFKADDAKATLNIADAKMTLHNVRRVVTYANTTVDSTTMTITGDADGVDAEMEHGFNRSPLVITDSTIKLENMVGRGITAQCGAVSVENSTVTMTNVQEATIDVRASQTVTVDAESKVTLDKEPIVSSGTISGNVSVVLPPKGTVTHAYTRANGFWGEGKANASESYVIKLYEGETVIASASLNDIGDIINGEEKNLTWSIPFAGSTDEYWTVVWVEGYPKYDMAPTKVTLTVDGTEVSANTVKYNAPDDLAPIIALAEGFTGGVQAYTSLADAVGDFNGRKVNVLRDVTESIESFNGATLTTNVEGGVTVTSTYSSWINANDFNIGKGVTVVGGKVFYETDGVNTVEGTLKVTETFYHGYNAKTTVQNGGSIAVTGDYASTILRYNTNADAGLYIYGDGDDSTVEFDCDYYIGAYSGTFYAEDANIETGYLLLQNSNDNSSYADLALTLDNSSLTVTGVSATGQDDLIIDDQVSVTLTNGSSLNAVDFVVKDGTALTLSVDEASTVKAKSVSVAEDVALEATLNADGTVTFTKKAVASVNGTSYVTLAEAVAALKTNGGTLVLLADCNESMTFNYPAEGAPTALTIDLNGFTVTSAESTLWVSDGYTVTVKDSSKAQSGTIITTSTGDEAFAIARGGKIILEGGKVVGVGYGVYLYSGKATGTEELVVNDGTIEVPNGGTAIAIGSGKVTVNGGKVLCNKVPGGSGWNTYVYQGGTLTITGGHFLGTIGNWGTTAISGGTFSYCDDPNDGFNSEHLAAGYKAQENADGSVTVVALPPAPEGFVWVSSYEQLVAALEKDNARVIMANDIIGYATENSGYGVAGIVLNAGDILDGNGKKLTINGADTKWDSAIAMRGGEVRNLTIAGAFRGVFMPGANGDVVVDNCVFEDVVYTFNSDAGSKAFTVTIKNTALNGWTSFSDAHKEVVFDTCTFGEGSGYAYCRPYQATTFKNCDFDEGYEFDATETEDNSLAFDDCTYNDAPITTENGGDMFAKGGKVLVDEESIDYTRYAQIVRGEQTLVFYSLADAVAAAQAGETIKLLENVTITEKFVLRNINADLNGNTMFLKTTGNEVIGNVTVENGTIDISGGTAENGNSYITVGGKWAEEATLNLNEVKLIGTDYASEWAVICVHNGKKLNIKDSEVKLTNDLGAKGGFLKDTSGVGNTAIVTIENTDIVLTDVDRGVTGTKLNLDTVELTITGGEHGINGAEVVALNSAISIADGTGRALTLSKYDACFTNTTLSFSNMGEGEIRFKTANALTIDGTSTLAAVNVHTDVTGATVNSKAITGTEGDMSTVTVADGTTTVVNPAIKIGTLAELQAFRDAVNAGNTYEGMTVCITADIDLAGINWEPIGIYKDQPFKGSFDGGNHIISNLTIDGDIVLGLFGYVNHATIKNVIIQTATIVGNWEAGAVVGYATHSTIENCSVKDVTITLTPRMVNGAYDDGNHAGGVVGLAGSSTVKNCMAEKVVITAYRDAGGVVGTIEGATIAGYEGIVENCSAADVSITIDQLTNFYKVKVANAGAIVGRLSNTGGTGPVVDGNVATGNISLKQKIAEGLILDLETNDYEIVGDTITLLGDVTLNKPLTIPAGKSVTLDLNGKTLSYTSDVMNQAMITNNGDLTITDSTDAKEGAILYTYTGAADTSYGKGNYTINNYGKLTVNAGTVRNATVKMSHAFYAVTSYGNGQIEINGGKIVTDNNHGLRLFASGNHKNCLTVNGGEIVGLTRAVWIQASGNNAANAPEILVTVTGGTLTGLEKDSTENRLAIYSYSYGDSMENIKLDISGGVFNGDIALTGGKNKNAIETVTVTGGTFNGEWGELYTYGDEAKGAENITITGGTFKTDAAQVYAADDGYQFKQNAEGTYEVEEMQGVAYIEIDGELKTVGSVYEVAQYAAANKLTCTITLVKDADEFMVGITPDMTLDLNGHTLTAGMLYATGEIIDSSKEETGLLKVTQGSVALEGQKTWLPVWNESDGYFFTQGFDINTNHIMRTNKDGNLELVLLPVFDEKMKDLMQDGSTDNGLTLTVRVTWNGSNGQASQDFTYSDELFDDVYVTGKAFNLIITNYADLNGLQYQILLVSDSQAELVGASGAYALS